MTGGTLDGGSIRTFTWAGDVEAGVRDYEPHVSEKTGCVINNDIL